jgi:geranylgeranyl diphosphate synthase, type II
LLGKPSKEIEIYGSSLGYAFQLTDDILGFTSSKEVLGKTPKLDIKNKKLTYLDILGLEKTKELAKEEINKAKKSLINYEKHYEYLYLIADYTINRIN